MLQFLQRGRQRKNSFLHKEMKSATIKNSFNMQRYYITEKTLYFNNKL